MKKVINGKVYNTETATMICSRSYGQGYRDFNAWEETLYVTKKGQFFLYYWGGANSKYSVYVSTNTRSESSGIKLLTEDEAREFAEKCNCDPDVYEKYFEVEEG
jgi:hypothetical protein